MWFCFIVIATFSPTASSQSQMIPQPTQIIASITAITPVMVELLEETVFFQNRIWSLNKTSSVISSFDVRKRRLVHNWMCRSVTKKWFCAVWYLTEWPGSCWQYPQKHDGVRPRWKHTSYSAWRPCGHHRDLPPSPAYRIQPGCAGKTNGKITSVCLHADAFY